MIGGELTMSRLLSCLVLAASCFLAVSARHAVNLALTSFNASPYILELLETAAEENATSYFPLLDRIADGVFADSSATELDLYTRFIRLVQDEGHLTDPAALSSFNFALALRATAPRVEAQYQYYNTSVEPAMTGAQDAACPVWAHYDGYQYCSSSLERAQQSGPGDEHQQVLPFDRVLGDDQSTSAVPPLTVYVADVLSPIFSEFHRELSQRARQGEFSYRVRYRPFLTAESKPLHLNGYGVGLALKRTDYIVIDDRDMEKKPSPGTGGAGAEDTNDDDEEPDISDLKPLSSSEVSRLGINTAAYIKDSDDPFRTLLRATQDFPRYSSAIAGRNASAEFISELVANQEKGLYPGNRLWVNGREVPAHNVDAFELLSQFRSERKLIQRLKDIGLSAGEAVSLISHPTIAQYASRASGEAIRFDYRDHLEGGDVIIWFNDMEQDGEYQDWPTNVQMYFSMFPGQLPVLRKDVHNCVIPVDLANEKDVVIVAKNIDMFLRRKLPIRFGIVPMLATSESSELARVAYHLNEAYGPRALITYLQLALQRGAVSSPDSTAFQYATSDEPREGQSHLSLSEVITDDAHQKRLVNTAAYLRRLAIPPNEGEQDPTLFMNGVPIPRDASYTMRVSFRLSADLASFQSLIMSGKYADETYFPDFYLKNSLPRRHKWVVPRDENAILLADMDAFYHEHNEILASFPRVTAAESSISDEEDSAEEQSEASSYPDLAFLVLIGDFTSAADQARLSNVLRIHERASGVETLMVQNTHGSHNAVMRLLDQVPDTKGDISDVIAQLSALAKGSRKQVVMDGEDGADSEHTSWSKAKEILASLNLSEGDSAIVVNGRLIGPLPPSAMVSEEDIDILLQYEKIKSAGPITDVLASLGLAGRIEDPLTFARLRSLIALSENDDPTEDFVEREPNLRSQPDLHWAGEHTSITVPRDEEQDPCVFIVATLDPASETGQRWAPILSVLSELAGVHLKIYLNPTGMLTELPIKRFYRHVLASAPSFSPDGDLIAPRASFENPPADALLTLAMDVPPSWQVAPRQSVHDLDNLKLSSLPSTYDDVEAVYELEHILIEGHARVTPQDTPPRGVQLLLGTNVDPHYDDTIVMANLGYFQFKAQPGQWRMSLKDGPSAELFNLDSVGPSGFQPKPEDAGVDVVTLTSFQGKKLFPRLSQKPGHEGDDVLEYEMMSRTPSLLSRGLGLVRSLVSGRQDVEKKQADINIYSVASGHLYERMLNIMMVSVMRHTNHTVKFWFIEQFLSPSFKSFLPHMAAEYGFEYEMVMYKWPAWLRKQPEKQREIWGYKILFLDVLFPLSLDKVIFVDADQIVRTDLHDLVTFDLEGAPYGFTPMGDSRKELEAFRFWKQGYWKTFLGDLPYHISALYVVDLARFRALAAGDRLRQQYQLLSADPNSLANLDQDLPNNMQRNGLPIKSLPQDWLWCETWCSDESLKTARTIDLCNNPLTKEPKLDRARRQVPEWTVYDDEIAALARRVRGEAADEIVGGEEGEGEEQASEPSPAVPPKDEL